MIVAIVDENKSTVVDQEALGLGKYPDKAWLLKNYVLMTKLAALERVRGQEIEQASNNHLLYTEAIEGVMNDGKI